MSVTPVSLGVDLVDRLRQVHPVLEQQFSRPVSSRNRWFTRQ
jgi:hypothetical protein